MELSARERDMLKGGDGEAAHFALSIIVRTGEALGAPRLRSIEHAHIDACALRSPSSLDFIQYLADNGGRVRVPTTTSMISLDLEHWEALGISRDLAEPSLAIAKAYLQVGCRPTWTCAPYQGAFVPQLGQAIAWGESNAVAYANSVLGARTNRTADYLDICAAITGRVPEVGLYLTENRRATRRIQLEPTPASSWTSPAAWGALGTLIGRLSDEQVPVIEGLPDIAPTSDQLKMLGAAAASAGSVGLFHLAGITPEAPDVESACQGDVPEAVLHVPCHQLREAWDELSSPTATGDVDAVVLGCPHFSDREFELLAAAIRQHPGATVHAHTQVFIFTSAAASETARRNGQLKILEDFGITLIRDSCPFYLPVVRPDARLLVTNSGKCAYYAPGELKVGVHYSDLEGCLHAAITGQRQDVDPPW